MMRTNERKRVVANILRDAKILNEFKGALTGHDYLRQEAIDRDLLTIQSHLHELCSVSGVDTAELNTR